MNMKIEHVRINASGIKCYISVNGVEIARAFLYILKNELHNRPFGLLEDLFVAESFRGKGYGKRLIQEVIKKAKENNRCKLICTSRYSKPKVHELYKKAGFKEHGFEFRIGF